MPRSTYIKRASSVCALLLAAAAALVHRVFTHAPSMQPFERLIYTREPAPLSESFAVQFFGTTNLCIRVAGQIFLIDGFFTRPSWAHTLLGRMEPDLAAITTGLQRGGVQSVDALFVAHSHHDHVLDAGVVAATTGALLLGSASALNVARGQGLPFSRMRELAGGSEKDAPPDAFTFGKVEVTCFVTPHSPDPVFPGSISSPLPMPARLWDFKLDAAYSFYLKVRHSDNGLLVVPSANFVPGLFNGLRAGTVLLSIGGLGGQPAAFIEAYWNATVRATGAELVLLIHYDDFAQPLPSPPARLPPAFPWALDDVPAAIAAVEALGQADGVKVGLLPLWEQVALP